MGREREERPQVMKGVRKRQGESEEKGLEREDWISIEGIQVSEGKGEDKNV